jgi:hypothetical protein
MSLPIRRSSPEVFNAIGIADYPLDAGIPGIIKPITL